MTWYQRFSVRPLKDIKIAIVYNEPDTSRYGNMGEAKAVLGVMDEVEAVHLALTELGYSVSKISLRPPVEQVRKRLERLDCGLAFNLFEGFDGCPETETIFAEILGEMGIPFTGCPPSALKLALDKSKTKSILASSGIDTPRHQLLNPENLDSFHLSFPCIVKPCGEDASHGLGEESVVGDLASLKNQVQKVSRLFGEEALVEEFIDGREFNATVIGNDNPSVLAISEIIYSLPSLMPRILTFASKWEEENIYFKGTKPECPAKIDESLREQIVYVCLSSYRLLGCRGYARVDMRQDARGKVHVLEVNPNPDISLSSGAALQAKAAGMTYTRFIERIVQLGFEN